MNERQISSIERNNRTAKLCHTIEAAIIAVIAVLWLVAGKRGIAYTLAVIVLSLAPVIAEQLFFAKDRETGMIKHLVGIGFAVTYSFLVLTADNSCIYVLVIPMIMVVSIFNDAKYSMEVNAGTVILSLIMVIGGATTGGFGYQGAESAAVQMTVMILTAIYSIYTATASKANFDAKIDEANEAKEQTEAVMNNIRSVSERMQSGMDDIYGKIEKLNQSSGETKDAMSQVGTGTTETANAVQSQMEQTEEIQHKVNTVSDAAGRISQSMEKTLAVLENANSDVELLVAQVEHSVTKGADVAEKLGTLDAHIAEMHSIVELISGITSQTSLLALNASIEAARAGEAGRGFSVVATEISGMATQTKDATAHITELIGNIAQAINEVVGVIREMIAGINEEKQSTENTAQSFADIRSNTFEIRQNVEQLAASMDELKTANQAIVDTIETISAISEEVSAHANETMAAQEENAGVLSHITDRMQELIEMTRQ